MGFKFCLKYFKYRWFEVYKQYGTKSFSFIEEILILLCRSQLKAWVDKEVQFNEMLQNPAIGFVLFLFFF